MASRTRGVRATLPLASGRWLARGSWLASAARILGLIALGVVLAHQALLLVRYGSIDRQVLVLTGHGQAWSDAVTIVVVGSALLLALALARLQHLGLLLAAGERTRRAAHRASVPSPDEPRPRAFLRAWLGMTIVVGLAITAGLTAQENLEHIAAGLPAPGPWMLLGPQYPMALPIVAIVATAVAFVGALLGWRRDVLIARLRAARTRFRPARRSGSVPRGDVPRPVLASLLARRLGRRAPPVPVAA